MPDFNITKHTLKALESKDVTLNDIFGFFNAAIRDAGGSKAFATMETGDTAGTLQALYGFARIIVAVYQRADLQPLGRIDDNAKHTAQEMLSDLEKRTKAIKDWDELQSKIDELRQRADLLDELEAVRKLTASCSDTVCVLQEKVKSEQEAHAALTVDIGKKEAEDKDLEQAVVELQGRVDDLNKHISCAKEAQRRLESHYAAVFSASNSVLKSEPVRQSLESALQSAPEKIAHKADLSKAIESVGELQMWFDNMSSLIDDMLGVYQEMTKEMTLAIEGGN